MSKHTPTPYYVEPDMGGTYNITVGPPTGLIIAKVNPYNDVPDEMAMHNAMRLAKAANCHYELLEALQGCIVSMESHANCNAFDRADDMVLRAARAAIAKAQPTNAD